MNSEDTNQQATVQDDERLVRAAEEARADMCEANAAFIQVTAYDGDGRLCAFSTYGMLSLDVVHAHYSMICHQISALYGPDDIATKSVIVDGEMRPVAAVGRA